MQRILADHERGLTAEHEAYNYILTSIRAGRYAPGDRLIADEIAAAIDMSRMPVREAFRRLATEGLVQLRPNRGCVVSGLTIDEIFEVFAIRAVLEGLAIRLAMPHIDSAALEELERRLALMQQKEAARDDWIACHYEFHDYLYSLCGRRRLIRQIRTQHVIVEPYLRIYFHHVEKKRTADEAHRVLFKEIKSGDASRAEQAMRDHVSGTAPLLAAFIEKKDGAHWKAAIATQSRSTSTKPR